MLPVLVLVPHGFGGGAAAAAACVCTCCCSRCLCCGGGDGLNLKLLPPALLPLLAGGAPAAGVGGDAPTPDDEAAEEGMAAAETEAEVAAAGDGGGGGGGSLHKQQRPRRQWGQHASVAADNIPLYLLAPKTDVHGLGFDPFKVCGWAGIDEVLQMACACSWSRQQCAWSTSPSLLPVCWVGYWVECLHDIGR